MPTMELLDVDALRATVSTYRDVMRVHAAAINRLNVYPVPDGDTGTNMARTLDAVVTEMDAAAGEMTPTCDAIAHGSLMGARGNSGVILSQIMRGLVSTLKQATSDAGTAGGRPTGPVVAEALTAAATAAYSAVLKPIEGTILTVVRESAEGASAAAEAGGDLELVLRAARDTGRDALERTPELLPVLRDAGVVDAGGAGFLLLLDAALHVVAGEPLPEAPAGDVDAVASEAVARVATRSSGVDGELDVSEQRYEVMFLCHLTDDRIEEFKQGWGDIGDSIVVVGGDGTWNCHIHTNDVGAAIEVALDVDGRPFRIRVTDLFEEVAAEHAQREAAMTTGAESRGSTGDAEVADLPDVTCAVVAVSSGPGISALFRDLGVQSVVAGGQTSNPSTAELLAAVDRLPAANIVLLPGNKNIIPVAEQVDALTAKTVRVVPTRSMPEGIAALMAYDPEADAPANVLAMRQAAATIDAGEVTQAVRASTTDVGPVQEGDWLSIGRSAGIVHVADSAAEATRELIVRLVGGDPDERELVTLITGADADDMVTAGLVDWFAGHYDGLELEVHAGGQPLYPYLVGVE